MKRNTIIRYIAYSSLCLFAYACASVGTPAGGYTDRIPPVPLLYTPQNGTTNFSEDKITILFNERIKFNDLRKNLIVSPHLDLAEHIKPTAAMPSKYLTIDLSEVELEPNTTYTINFGNCVVDFNENNALQNFKYVFSTGPKIDSLMLGGVVASAFEKGFDKNTSIMLYKIDSTYTDSTIYKERPSYFTRVAHEKDSTFRIDNISPGTYQLIAMVDDAGNMKFDPLKDQIAFFPRPIVLNDSTWSSDKGYLLRLALQDAPYKVYQGANIEKGQIQVTMTGFTPEYTVERVLPALPEGATDMFIYSEHRDTLNYWSSAEEKDSIVFFVRKGEQITDTINAKIRRPTQSDFTIKTGPGTIHLYENIVLSTNKPIISADTSKIHLSMASDSSAIPYTIKIDSIRKNRAEIVFNQTQGGRYLLDIYPGALISILGEESKDTLLRTVKSYTNDDYGHLKVNLLSFDQYPMIVQLLSSDGKTVVREQTLTNTRSVIFDMLPPNRYGMRIIFDTNGNGKWDTVDFLNHIQPERVHYMKDDIEIRAMWSESIDW